MTPEATNAAEAVRSDWAGSVPPEQAEAMAASVAAAVDAGAIVRPTTQQTDRTFRLSLLTGFLLILGAWHSGVMFAVSSILETSPDYLSDLYWIGAIGIPTTHAVSHHHPWRRS